MTMMPTARGLTVKGDFGRKVVTVRGRIEKYWTGSKSTGLREKHIILYTHV
jgi:hypothetical protein